MPRTTALLVDDPAALDLDAVRSAADAQGWDIALERLDGSPADDVAGRDAWFAVPLRVRITARDDADEPDARVLLRASRGLRLDERRELH